MNKYFLIAVVIIVAIVLIFFVVMLAYGTKNSNSSNTNSTNSGYNYVQSGRGLWDSNINPVQCSETVYNGYCIIPATQAQSLCNSKPECTGYVVNDGVWVGHPGTAYAQLLSTEPVNNGGWQDAIYYKKIKN